ncbi:MAG: hypothetical protein HQK54_17355, partial [Oligoflexales bacterium]|nr:hypothetical protein [Oligoflexales bacterium]
LQGKKNIEKARTLLEKVLRDGRGPADLDEKAYRALEEINKAPKASPKAPGEPDAGKGAKEVTKDPAEKEEKEPAKEPAKKSEDKKDPSKP